MIKYFPRVLNYSKSDICASLKPMSTKNQQPKNNTL